MITSTRGTVVIKRNLSIPGEWMLHWEMTWRRWMRVYNGLVRIEMWRNDSAPKSGMDKDLGSGGARFDSMRVQGAN